MSPPSSPVVRACLVAGLLALLSLIGSTPAASAQDAAPAIAPPVGLELLDATLWMQHSAERRAACLQAYALAGDRLVQALADPSWTALTAQRPGYEQLPPAVILDVDETVLDNHWFEARLVKEQRVFDLPAWGAWCAEAAATPVPGALSFCLTAARAGVEVFYVTNRRGDVAEATRQNLATHGFPFADDLSHLLTRGPDPDKQQRRETVAATHRVLLLVGDNGGDFTSDLGRQPGDERSEAVDRHAHRWGQSWIMLPNPMYGDWLPALLGSTQPATPAEQVAVLVDSLRGQPVTVAPDPISAGAARGVMPRAAATVVTAHLSTSSRSADPATLAGDHDHADDESATSAADLRAGPSRHALLASGPMVIDSSTTTVTLWLQTTRPASVQVRHWPAGAEASARLTPALQTRADGDLLAAVRLAGLAPGVSHVYEVFLDGTRVASPWPLEFTTQPRWRWQSGDAAAPHSPPDLRIVLGSCHYVNDPPSDRPGAPYGGGYEILETMADEQAQIYLWLGDNVYYRQGDWTSEEAMRHRYAHTRALPEMQRLLSTGSHVAIWDDHDYGPNDSDRSFPLASTALRVFADYWPEQVLGLPDTPGCFRVESYADVDLFLLDDRTHRSPNAAPADAQKVMLGRQQLNWLKDALLASDASVKLIVNGGQMLNPVVNFEGFSAFPHEQAELLGFLADERIENVLFLSGDRHHSELLKLERQGLEPLYEFTCSPLTAGTPSDDLDGQHAARVPGTWVNRRNYGVLEIRGPYGDRSLSLSVHDAAGNAIWKQTLP